MATDELPDNGSAFSSYTPELCRDIWEVSLLPSWNNSVDTSLPQVSTHHAVYSESPSCNVLPSFDYPLSVEIPLSSSLNLLFSSCYELTLSECIHACVSSLIYIWMLPKLHFWFEYHITTSKITKSSIPCEMVISNSVKCKSEIIAFLTKILVSPSVSPNLTNVPTICLLSNTVNTPVSYPWPKSFSHIFLANQKAEVDFKLKPPDSQQNGYILIYLYLCLCA